MAAVQDPGGPRAVQVGTDKLQRDEVILADALGNAFGGSIGDVIAVTLTIDTSAYQDLDVFADTQTIANVTRAADVAAVLFGLTVIDGDDIGQAIDFYFFKAARSLGTENSAPNISDANALDILGKVRVESVDYQDLGGVKVAYVPVYGLNLKPIAGTRSIGVGAIIRGAGTYPSGAMGLALHVGW